jgi:hypothetical protein
MGGSGGGGNEMSKSKANECYDPLCDVHNKPVNKEAIAYTNEQREMISKQAKGKIIESMEWEGDYWVITFTDGSEISLRLMAELEQDKALGIQAAQPQRSEPPVLMSTWPPTEGCPSHREPQLSEQEWTPEKVRKIWESAPSHRSATVHLAKKINAALGAEREKFAKWKDHWQQVAEAHDCESLTDAFVQLGPPSGRKLRRWWRRWNESHLTIRRIRFTQLRLRWRR